MAIFQGVGAHILGQTIWFVYSFMMCYVPTWFFSTLIFVHPMTSEDFGKVIDTCMSVLSQLRDGLFGGISWHNLTMEIEPWVVRDGKSLHTFLLCVFVLTGYMYKSTSPKATELDKNWKNWKVLTNEKITEYDTNGCLMDYGTFVFPL